MEIIKRLIKKFREMKEICSLKEENRRLTEEREGLMEILNRCEELDK
jgi:hypothetical protein